MANRAPQSDAASAQPSSSSYNGLWSPIRHPSVYHSPQRIDKTQKEVVDIFTQYMSGIPEEYLAHYDPPAERKNYLRMQGELCDLRWADRALLGRHFAGLMDAADKTERPGMMYASVQIDCKPDFVYVLASGRGESRLELLERARVLLLGAMAFYAKRRGMVIVDRDYISFEVSLIGVPSHSIAAFHEGERLFGKLRMDHIAATLVPRPHRLPE